MHANTKVSRGHNQWVIINLKPFGFDLYPVMLLVELVEYFEELFLKGSRASDNQMEVW